MLDGVLQLPCAPNTLLEFLKHFRLARRRRLQLLFDMRVTRHCLFVTQELSTSVGVVEDSVISILDSVL